MKNKQLKQMLVDSGVYEGFCYQMWQYHKQGDFADYPEKYHLSDEEYNACCQLRNAKNQCWTRLYDHIGYLNTTYEKVYFITLTFNDSAMKLTRDTRRQLIHRMLNKYCDDYVANIDYGKQNEREHYHAVIVPKMECDIQLKRSGNRLHYCSDLLDHKYLKYGFYYIELVNCRVDDVKAVSRYIAKLCNHSIKVKQSKIMTKKQSDYHFYQRHMDRFMRMVPLDSPTFTDEKTINKLEEIFGVDGFDIVYD